MTENDIDVEIADFRKSHEEALMSRGHPEHGVRAQQLSALYERKFGGDVEGEASASSSRSPSPEPSETDKVGGDEPADDLARLAEPAQQPSDYDFSKMERPFGVEVEENEDLERYAREWLHSGGISPAEGQALSSIYAESLSYTPDQIERMAEQTGRDLTAKYGDDVGAAATAALKVADETSGLRDFLEGSGLINHPRVIDNLIKTATKRGYFQPSRG